MCSSQPANPCAGLWLSHVSQSSSKGIVTVMSEVLLAPSPDSQTWGQLPPVSVSHHDSPPSGRSTGCGHGTGALVSPWSQTCFTLPSCSSPAAPHPPPRVVQVDALSLAGTTLYQSPGVVCPLPHDLLGCPYLCQPPSSNSLLGAEQLARRISVAFCLSAAGLQVPGSFCCSPLGSP